jgi:hypothetical protein
VVCQGEFFVKNPFDVEENDDFALFGLGEFGLSVYGSCFLSRTLV